MYLFYILLLDYFVDLLRKTKKRHDIGQSLFKLGFSSFQGCL